MALKTDSKWYNTIEASREECSDLEELHSAHFADQVLILGEGDHFRMREIMDIIKDCADKHSLDELYAAIEHLHWRS